MTTGRRAGVGLLLSAAIATAACGPTADNNRSSASSPGRSGGGSVAVVASFYPLQWIAEQVTGAPVASLTKPGAEPHEAELAPRDVERVTGADLVVYLRGFQPAVDAAVSQEAEGRGYDVSPAAGLQTYAALAGRAGGGTGGNTDRHFWLDPTKLAAVGEALAVRLAAVDPAGAARYARNAGQVKAKLAALDRDLRTGLATCANRTVVTSHNAFGYLARRYGLTQVGITGSTPESEPKPADLRAVAQLVQRTKVRTIYYEPLVSDNVARTVAQETGADTAVLDPVEGLTSVSRGRDYLAVMRGNLAALRAGQPCR